MTELKLPPKIKPGTLTAFVWELSRRDKRATAQDTVDAVKKEFPGNTYARQTILALRSQFGMHERTRPTPTNAKSAAPVRSPKTAKRKYTRKAAEANGNGHTEAPASSNGASLPRAVTPTDAFLALVKRIGTDAARAQLDSVEKG